MLKKSKPVVAAIGCFLLGLVPFTGVVADELDEAEGERCILLNRISSTYIVDDYNILFYMRGGKIYRNPLPHRCGGLRNERRFMYRTSMSRLCDLDIITVLYDQGFGLMPGPSCGLGRFYPITEEDAEALKNAPPSEPPAEDLPTAEPEEIGEPE